MKVTTFVRIYQESLTNIIGSEDSTIIYSPPPKKILGQDCFYSGNTLISSVVCYMYNIDRYFLLDCALPRPFKINSPYEREREREREKEKERDYYWDIHALMTPDRVKMLLMSIVLLCYDKRVGILSLYDAVNHHFHVID